MTVASLLRGLGHNLRVNRKRITGPYHPDRDRPFAYSETIVELELITGRAQTSKNQYVSLGQFNTPLKGDIVPMTAALND
jgi:hypothetical protein